MNQSWEVICAAINQSLLGSNVAFTETTDWNAVFQEVRKQGIYSIVYHSVKPYLPQDIEKTWYLINIQSISHYIQVIHEQEELIHIVQKAGYKLIILKGSAASVYYPNSKLRTMGDVDFIVPEDQFEDIKHLLCSEGFDLDKNSEHGLRHVVFSKNGIIFEMHRKFSHDELDVDTLINGCYDNLDIGHIESTTFPMLPTLENGIILLAHLRQHLITGVGIRQILDWMMFVNAYVDDEYWESTFRPVTEMLGIDKLAITATRFCQIYLGLNPSLRWCSSAEESVCKRLMDSIISSGNFGHNNGRGQGIEGTIIHLRKNGIFSYLQMAGKYNWKTSKKHKCLESFAWIYQIGRYLRQGIQTGRKGKNLRDDIHRSAQRYKLLRDLGIVSRDVLKGEQ